MMDLKFSRFFKSRTGVQLLSIMLWLAETGLFKMSYDSVLVLFMKDLSLKRQKNGKI